MDVLSACPLPVASLRWQTPARGASLAVICKATYRLEPIESRLAEAQDPPVEHDVYRHDDPAGSLRLGSDLVPFKRRAEVLLVGHAYAPRHEAVRSLRVRLLVGEVDKSIDVFADRAFTLEGQLREGPRFTQMPLVWQRAAGGPDTSNPSGIRLDAAPDAFGQRPVPNLQPPGLHVQSPDDLILPVGFGPLAPSWPGRWQKLGRHASGWDPRRWTERPLPDDLDPGYFNAALPDQQLESIRPNERLVLENLHPEHPRLVTNLAPATPRARVEWATGGAEEIRFRCDTIWIDTDRCTCSLTWRATLPLDHPERQGKVTVTLAQSARGTDERRRWGGLGSGATSAPGSSSPGSAEALPFSRTSSEVPPPLRADAPLPVPPPSRIDSLPIAPPARLDAPLPVAPPARLDLPAGLIPPAQVDPPRAPAHARVERTLDAPVPGGMPALPFRVGRSPLAGSVLGQRPSSMPGTPAPAPQPGPALPFTSASSSPAPLPAPSQHPRAGLPFAPVGPPPQLDFDETADEITTDHDPFGSLPFASTSPDQTLVPVPSPSAAPPPLPFVGAQTIAQPPSPPPPALHPVAPPPPALHPIAPLADAPPPPALRAWSPPSTDIVAPPLAVPAPPPPPAPVSPPPALTAPPPMLGPLATPEMLAASASPPPEAEPAPLSTPEAEPAASPEAEPVVELPLARYPLDRCARIAASIARRKPETAAILDEHDLAPATWTALDAHWAEAIAAETRRGKTALLKRYDAAYVARIEEERGQLEVPEIARLTVASEQGTVDEVIRELGLPKGAVLRIQRLWLAKITADPVLAGQVRVAVEQWRET